MEWYLICNRFVFLLRRNSWQVMFSTGLNGCFILRSGKKCNFLRRWPENFLFLWYAITSSTMVLNKVLPCLPNPSSFGGWDFKNFHSFIFIFTTSFRNSLNVWKKKSEKNIFVVVVVVVGEWRQQFVVTEAFKQIELKICKRCYTLVNRIENM